MRLIHKLKKRKAEPKVEEDMSEDQDETIRRQAQRAINDAFLERIAEAKIKDIQAQNELLRPKVERKISERKHDSST